MSRDPGGTPESETVTVRYWASARAAAGVDEDHLAVDGPTSLADVVRRVLEARPSPRLADVLGVCSVLVGDRPVGGKDREAVTVRPGDSIEFLPPFAGG
ncbi:MoaD/ThiS family protein [Nocardioides seonyuensis]|uniref:MoaD/ThiS family protein n=1 Tax=Nocardioides seonyuensis TaxID=2518371 RepID=A0A4P7IEZ4_9ACTN|nr:MoaD/ThiS family protein [Nocardioides seonyuensis]QBX55834.1 MoaD/ThiS family protein [Nocardioides seonyuensis]